MDLQSNELRNSIMEEVILKNYKLLQFVENEMNKLKEEMNHLKEENAHLKEENTHLKEENKLTHDKIETLQTKIDNSGIESNILIGYTGVNNPVYCNYNFNKECKSLPLFLESCNCKILLKLSVFRQLSTYYNFNCLDLDQLCKTQHPCHEWISKINFVDGNDITCISYLGNRFYSELERISHICKLKINTPKPIIITSYYLDNGQPYSGRKYTFPLLDKLINILNKCNIKLTLSNKYELYLDETNKINYRQIDNSMINNFRGINPLIIKYNDPNKFCVTIEQ